MGHLHTVLEPQQEGEWPSQHLYFLVSHLCSFVLYLNLCHLHLIYIFGLHWCVHRWWELHSHDATSTIFYSYCLYTNILSLAINTYISKHFLFLQLLGSLTCMLASQTSWHKQMHHTTSNVLSPSWFLTIVYVASLHKHCSTPPFEFSMH